MTTFFSPQKYRFEIKYIFHKTKARGCIRHRAKNQAISPLDIHFGPKVRMPISELKVSFFPAILCNLFLVCA